MLVLCQAGPTASLRRGVAGVADGHRYLSQGQHVAVRVVAPTVVAAPGMGLVEHGVHVAPVVPEVVHHAPHVGVGKAFLGVGVLGLAGTDGEHDGTARLVDGAAYHVQLVGVERTGKVVNLDEIDTPLGVEVHDAVVVELSPFIVAHQEVVLQPCAG